MTSRDPSAGGSRSKAAPQVHSQYQRGSWRPLAAIALILIAGGWAYHNSLHGPFVLDDVSSIPDNASLRHWRSALHPPSGAGLTVEGRPILNLSFELNYAAGGVAVAGYHAVNLGIHLLAALTLFAIVRRTLAGQAGAPNSDRPLRVATISALLWVAHPLQTESVTYVAQRAESLAGLFYLFALYALVRSRSGVPAALERPPGLLPESGGDAASTLWLAVSVFSCLLGMGTKEVVVTAPLLIAGYDRIFMAGSWRALWRRRRVYYLALAGTWLLLAALVAGAGSRGQTIGPSSGVAWWGYALSQSRAVLHYLRLAIWPAPLVIDYGSVWVGWREAVPALAALGGLLTLTGFLLRRRPQLGFLAAAFFVLLAPSSSVIGGTRQMWAEHRMYLALAPVAVLAALGLIRSGVTPLSEGEKRRAAASTFPAFVLVVVLMFLTSRRNADYATALGLYADTATKRPDNAYAQGNYGFALAEAHRPQEAFARFQRAVALKPDYARAHFNLGVLLCQFGRAPEGIAEYRTALRWEPAYPDAHNNLGVALAQSGQVAEAAAHFAAAVRLRPGFADAADNLATARRQLGDTRAGKP
jgi:tetratricopeptide (TPR) repeat protein